MKKLFLSLFVVTVIAAATGFSIKNESTKSQTEEYALLHLTESWQYRSISIATTIGASPTTYETVTREKKEKFNWAPIIQKMNEINAQGYELLNSSISVSEDEVSRAKYYSYTFVKKIK